MELSDITLPLVQDAIEKSKIKLRSGGPAYDPDTGEGCILGALTIVQVPNWQQGAQLGKPLDVLSTSAACRMLFGRERNGAIDLILGFDAGFDGMLPLSLSLPNIDRDAYEQGYAIGKALYDAKVSV